MQLLYTCNCCIHAIVVYMQLLYTCNCCIHAIVVYMQLLYTCNAVLYTCNAVVVYMQLLYTSIKRLKRKSHGDEFHLQAPTCSRITHVELKVCVYTLLAITLYYLGELKQSVGR